MDPLFDAAGVSDVAEAAAAVFEDVHLASAAPEVRAAARATLVDLVAIAILAYLDRTAPGPH